MTINPRSKFPLLAKSPVYLDNSGGTQMVSHASNHIIRHLDGNDMHGKDIIHQNRLAIKDLIHASDAREIVFGPNMTTLTFQLSRSFGVSLKNGDRIAVSRLDHDANISPWLQMAADHRCEIDWIDFHPETFSLDIHSLEQVLERKPRLVAVTCASNVVGTVTPIRDIIRMCHQAGAIVFLDAVQYAPHHLIDVQDWGCDFMAFSLHKLFGPHLGVLYGRYNLLEGLFSYQIQSGNLLPPQKFETGNQKAEGVYGLPGIIEYLEWLGESAGAGSPLTPPQPTGRMMKLKRAFTFIEIIEQDLRKNFLTSINEIEGVTLFARTAIKYYTEDIPVFSFSVEGFQPAEIEQKLMQAGIQIWSGHFHASEVMRRLGKDEGLARASLCHYNTTDEIQQFKEALAKIVRTKNK